MLPKAAQETRDALRVKNESTEVGGEKGQKEGAHPSQPQPVTHRNTKYETDPTEKRCNTQLLSNSHLRLQMNETKRPGT